MFTASLPKTTIVGWLLALGCAQAIAGVQIINSIGTNIVGQSTGSTNWGVHTTCPDPNISATCDANLGNGYFNSGSFSHVHFFEVPSLLPGYQGDISAVAPKLTTTVQASGVVFLFKDIGIVGTAETSGPDIKIGSFSFDSSASFIQAQSQTMHFDGLIAGGRYFYWVNGTATAGTSVNSYQLNSQLYEDPSVVTAVPEPAEWLLLTCGLLSLGALVKFRRAKESEKHLLNT
jgi:hypothetical protein